MQIIRSMFSLYFLRTIVSHALPGQSCYHVSMGPLLTVLVDSRSRVHINPIKNQFETVSDSLAPGDG